MHPGAGEAALCEGRETRELAVKLTRERAQVRGTCRDTGETRMKASGWIDGCIDRRIG